MNGDPCCVEAQTFAAEARSCEALACDPTLEACCQRDLEQQAVVARLKAKLSIHDRSKERLRMAGQVLGRAHQAQPAAPPPAQSGSDLESDDDDVVLGLLQAQRLQQLQREAESKAAVLRQGHGSVSDVPESRLLREAQAAGAPLVCHLALEGSPLDDELDEHLAALAHQNLGTRFVRTVINPRSSTLHLKLRSPPGPGLLCFRDGSVVGAAGLDHFGAPECILEEAVDKWLRQLKVLHLLPRGGPKGVANAATHRQGDGVLRDDGSSDEEAEDEEADEWQQACEVCGRRYPHQHIRSVRATRGSGSDSD